MDVFQTILLAIIQGITEFLPISSSAHLILPAQLLGWPDQGLAFDVAVHFGSLLAVIFYFRQDLRQMIAAWLVPAGDVTGGHRRTGAMLVLATLPAVIVGGLFASAIEEQLRSPLVIAAATIVFGLFLAVAEFASRRQQTVLEITWVIALAIGCAQVFALIPGASRSGVTITAAVLLGLSRTDAARFSLLLAIPLIIAATALQLHELLQSASEVVWRNIVLGVVLSGVSAYLCIGVFIRFVERIGLMPFVWYRLILGAVLLWLFYGAA